MPQTRWCLRAVSSNAASKQPPSSQKIKSNAYFKTWPFFQTHHFWSQRLSLSGIWNYVEVWTRVGWQEIGGYRKYCLRWQYQTEIPDTCWSKESTVVVFATEFFFLFPLSLKSVNLYFLFSMGETYPMFPRPPCPTHNPQKNSFLSKCHTVYLPYFHSLFTYSVWVCTSMLLAKDANEG